MLYYRTRIGNESTEPSVSATSKKLEVKYSDDKSTITATDIGLGWSQDFTCDESKSAIMTSGSILQNVQNDINLYDCWSEQTG